MRDLDDLKQLLHLEAPKINLSVFDKMNIDDEAAKQKRRRKKLSGNQKMYQDYIKERDTNVQLNKNPKDLFERQAEGIQEEM